MNYGSSCGVPYRLRKAPGGQPACFFVSAERRSAQRVLSTSFENPTEVYVNKEHMKGAADKAKGAMEHAAGKATGNERLKEKGNMDKTKGELHKAAGDMKDAAKRSVRE